jgi:hypothetical protein
MNSVCLEDMKDLTKNMDEDNYLKRKHPQKKKGRLGRPPTGVTPARSVRLSPAIWAAIDRWQHTRMNKPILTSSGAVRELLLIALHRERVEVGD